MDCGFRELLDDDQNGKRIVYQAICYFTHLGEEIEVAGRERYIIPEFAYADARPISDRLVILARFLENLYESAPDSSKGHHKVKPVKPCSRPDYTPHTGSARTPLTFDQEKLKNIFGNLSAAQTAAKLKKIAEKGMDNKTEALKIAKDLQAKIDEVWGKATEPERKALLEAAKAWGQVLAELGESFAFTQPKDAPKPAPKPALAPEDKVARPSAPKPIPAPEDGVKLAPTTSKPAPEISLEDEFAALGDLVGGKAGELAKEAAAMLRAATAAKEAAAMLRGAGLGDLADEFSELAGMLK